MPLARHNLPETRRLRSFPPGPTNPIVLFALDSAPGTSTAKVVTNTKTWPDRFDLKSIQTGSLPLLLPEFSSPRNTGSPSQVILYMLISVVNRASTSRRGAALQQFKDATHQEAREVLFQHKANLRGSVTYSIGMRASHFRVCQG